MEKTIVPDGIPTGSNIANAGGDPGANANHIESRTADHNAVTIEPERDTIQVGADGNLVVPRDGPDIDPNDGSEICFASVESGRMLRSG